MISLCALCALWPFIHMKTAVALTPFSASNLRQAGDDLVHTLRRHLLMVVKIDLHTWREIAIAQAFDFHQREPAVRRGLADSAAEFVFDPLGDLFRAPEPA